MLLRRLYVYWAVLSTIVVLVSVVKILYCSKRLAFLLQDLKLISNQQQLISKTDTNAQTI